MVHTSGTVSSSNHLTHDHTNSSTVSYSLNDDAMQEILSRVPVKSIVRFKCVSQDWLATIENEKFIALHGSNSKPRPCICITVQGEDEVSLYTASLSGDSETVSFVENIKYSAPHGLVLDMGDFEDDKFNFNPVNGLTCLYYYDGQICIYNISTREKTSWTVPPFKKFEYYFDNGHKEDKLIHVQSHYRFGFDPVKKEYKVIFIGEITEADMENCTDVEEYMVCNVLKMARGGGPGSWKARDANDIPMCAVKNDGVHVDGFIYWMDEPYSIVAFNVGHEEFIEISFPKGFYDKAEVYDEYGPVEVDGRIALIKRIRMDTIRLWILVEDNSWTEETILLTSSPERLLNERYDFLSITRSNLIILVPKDMEPEEKDEVFLYCYDWQMKTFQEFDITGILPMLTPDSTYSIAGYMESLSAHV